VYGFGESMGAALVLQSLAVERRFCAVVADSAFSSFRAVAYDRVGYYVHLGRWFGQTAGRLPVEIGLLYAKWRYGLDLRDANPEKALGGSDTPVLLIHGRADVNIRPWHSERMAAEFPTHVQLWEVSGANHGGAITVQHEMFQTKLVGWFSAHSTPNRL
jgi:pimeloyl-ACP methyl ester carboxylesterase